MGQRLKTFSKGLPGGWVLSGPQGQPKVMVYQERRKEARHKEACARHVCIRMPYSLTALPKLSNPQPLQFIPLQFVSSLKIHPKPADETTWLEGYDDGLCSHSRNRAPAPWFSHKERGSVGSERFERCLAANEKPPFQSFWIIGWRPSLRTERSDTTNVAPGLSTI